LEIQQTALACQQVAARNCLSLNHQGDDCQTGTGCIYCSTSAMDEFIMSAA
jgi:hypothetical protein